MGKKNIIIRNHISYIVKCFVQSDQVSFHSRPKIILKMCILTKLIQKEIAVIDIIISSFMHHLFYFTVPGLIVYNVRRVRAIQIVFSTNVCATIQFFHSYLKIRKLLKS